MRQKKSIYLFLLLTLFGQSQLKAQQVTWSAIMAKNTGLYDQSWSWRAQFPNEKIKEIWNKGLYLSDLSYGDGKWVIVSSNGTGYTNQKWSWRRYFPQEQIRKAWDDGYYISNLVYGNIEDKGAWAVVMSKGTGYQDQKWYTRSYYPKEEIKEAWKEGYYINSVTYGDDLWALVMSKGMKYKDQKWYTRHHFPAKEIKESWKEGFDITSLSYGDGLWALVVSKGTGYTDQTWYTRTEFPEDAIKKGWDAGYTLQTVQLGYDQKEDEPEAVPLITWQAPAGGNTSTQESFYKIQACVDSPSDIVSTKIYINGSEYSHRGFDVVPTDGCDMLVTQQIPLREGDNRIKVVVTNQGGSSTSELRTIHYQKTIVNRVDNEKRVALIIGNGDYQSSPLRNPTNDARSMARELRSLGFEVLEHIDASHEDMERAIVDFGRKIKDGGVGLFYYAGHGLQVKGNNYLVPVDAQIESETEVKFRSVNLGILLAKMEDANNRMNIVILDACRNNPFKRSWRSAEEGLAATISPTGTFIAYATAPGSVASDGSGVNGLYTQELLKAIRIPNLKIEDVFKKVRSNVRRLSSGQQVPWESSSIEGNFYFRK